VIKQMMLVILFAVVVCLLYIYVSGVWKNEACPQQVVATYRSVEPTGAYGSARYYWFGTKGDRHQVTQGCFDSLVDVSRK